MATTPRRPQRSGIRNERIAMQRATRTTSTHGDSVEAWTGSHIEFARVSLVSAKEPIQAGQAAPIATHEVAVPFIGTIATDWRVLYRSRALDIEILLDATEEDKRELFGSLALNVVGVEHGESNRDTVLMCASNG